MRRVLKSIACGSSRRERGAHDSSAQEEVVLVHVEFSGRLEDLGAHVEGEEELVTLKQTATRVPDTTHDT